MPLSKQEILSFPVYLCSNNSEIFENYDIIVDASDNAKTRYLINDAAIIHGKPVVSGSALRWEGQLSVYGYKGGPCYRCLFPCQNQNTGENQETGGCDDVGVCGPVPGIIGTLQALEVIKICLDRDSVLTGKYLIFDAIETTMKTVSLRPRQVDCAVCGDNPSIKSIKDFDYKVLCSDKIILLPNNLISIHELEQLHNKIIIDVRPYNHWLISNLKDSINLPITVLKDINISELKNLLSVTEFKKDTVIVTVCRRGNNSAIAVKILSKILDISIKSLIGGLTEYQLFHTSFPLA
eukprot:GHVL01015078.1.p1 GENE.GHVL01015078.1~~GHVL01015078.1.p1  ORF type:complete len:294 (+),score=59.13 GHVL01015078.1:292-1173(+)